MFHAERSASGQSEADFRLGFGDRLAEARRKAGRYASPPRSFTQTDIASHVGVTGAAVSAWEAGRNEPTMYVVQRIAALMGISPGWLAFGEGVMLPAATPTQGIPIEPAELPGAVWRGRLRAHCLLHHRPAHPARCLERLTSPRPLGDIANRIRPARGGSHRGDARGRLPVRSGRRGTRLSAEKGHLRCARGKNPVPTGEAWRHAATARPVMLGALGYVLAPKRVLPAEVPRRRPRRAWAGSVDTFSELRA